MASLVSSYFITVYDKSVTSTDTEFGETKNDISGSTTSLKDTKYKQVQTKDNAHDNGLGVGRSANMGDFNPFLLNVLKVHCNVSERSFWGTF